MRKKGITREIEKKEVEVIHRLLWTFKKLGMHPRIPVVWDRYSIKKPGAYSI